VKRGTLAVFVAAFCSPALAACSFFLDVSALTASGGDGGDGGNAGPAGEAATRFCADAGPHAFCADFDDDVDPLSLWTETHVDAPAQASVSTSRTRSAPRALHAFNPRQAAGATRFATLEKGFDQAWRRVVVDLDLYLEPPAFSPGDRTFGLMGVNFSSSSLAETLALSIGSDVTGLGGGTSASYTYDNGPALPTGTWVHAHVDATPGDGVTMTLADHTYSVHLPSTAPGARPQIQVEVGVFGFNAPSPEVSVYIDNLTVDFP
jgi:hypothetical protein